LGRTSTGERVWWIKDPFHKRGMDGNLKEAVQRGANLSTGSVQKDRVRNVKKRAERGEAGGAPRQSGRVKYPITTKPTH